MLAVLVDVVVVLLALVALALAVLTLWREVRQLGLRLAAAGQRAGEVGRALEQARASRAGAAGQAGRPAA